ncbi:glycosyltransferase 87 family protein [Streptomyces sp. HPF1205]|uniref:glycosyltransferase 87 family protein n=1 Tax=Streptomyces sp. HPF1205 TaxID=2873262 RepID=UPI001CED8FAC|nr:glycosyltransferase 87 family protein [Streptomyces sp. HPF1205]
MCLVSFAAVWTAQRALRVSLLDVMVYRAVGWTVRSGGDVYGLRVMTAGLPMTYPPFAGLLFVPLTWVGVGAMRTLVTAANLLLTVALAALSLRLVGRPGRPAAVLAVAALAVWSEPVWTTLRYGQINLLLAVLVLWDLTRAPAQRWAGVGIGIAAGIKLTPALFVVLLAVAGLLARGTPYLRRALVAAGTFAATVLIGAVALPHDSRRYWTSVAWAPGRPGRAENVANQSLRGVVARLGHTAAPGPAWLLLSLVVAAAGLACAVAALLAGRSLRNGTAWATLACAVTALLVSPVSWSHHWVWAVPVVVLLVTEAVRDDVPADRAPAAARVRAQDPPGLAPAAASRRRSAGRLAAAMAVALVFCSYVIWSVPHGVHRPELRENAAEMVLAAAYPLVGLAFLAMAGSRAARAMRDRPRRITPVRRGGRSPARSS